MWTREELKRDGKNFVKRHLKKAVLVTLIFWIISSLFGNQQNSGVDYATDRMGISTSIQTSANPFLRFRVGTPSLEFDQDFSREDYDINGNFSREWIESEQPSRSSFLKRLAGSFMIMVSLPIFIALMIISLLGKFIIFNPIRIGKAAFFVEGYEKEPEVKDLFRYFKSPYYRELILNLFVKDLYLFLWSLLFIIPGIYKYYQYIYVDYLLMEDPSMTIHDAIDRSKEMTDGEKWNIFILDMSFIGWYFLSALLLGIPGLLVDPYVDATFGRLYLRKKVVMNLDNRSLPTEEV